MLVSAKLWLTEEVEKRKIDQENVLHIDLMMERVFSLSESRILLFF